MHRVQLDYSELCPCPNGLPIDDRKPGSCEPWRQRVAKARRDAELFDSEWRLRDVAESISVDEILKDVEAIRTWANSLQSA